MMRVGVYAGALLVVATTIGWLLLQGADDTGQESSAQESSAARLDSARDPGAVHVPTHVPSDRSDREVGA